MIESNQSILWVINMRVRKFLALLLAFSLLSGCFALTASALNNDVKYIAPLRPSLHDSSGNMKDSLSVFKSNVNEEDFREIILSGISVCDKEIDISSLHIPVSAYEAVLDYVWYNMPEAFSIMSMGASYTTDNVLLELIVIYRDFADTESEYNTCINEFRASAEGLLSGIKDNSELSDLEKALLLHDRLCLTTEYDFVTASEIKHTAYGAFVKGKAVCQGYAMAYMYLLQQIGIKNYYCSSDALNHAWNIIYINNLPYHVDVTWDDIAWGSNGRGFEGRVYHNNFLRSTAGIRSTGHNAYDFDNSPTDTSFDSSFMQNSTTAFQLINNEIYYIDNAGQTLKRMSDKKTLCNLNAVWYYTNGGAWADNFSCLDSEKGYLLYSLPDGIYKYSPLADTSEKIYSPALSGYNSIFGFTYKDESLVCDINTSPTEISTLSQIKYEYTDFQRSVLNISLGELPSKTVYNIGDKADYSGLSLIKSYSDGTDEIITSGFEITGFDTSATGEKELTVHFEGYTFSFKISVTCAHINKTEEPEISPTCKSTGISAGVYCNDCKIYISGHEELPVNSNFHKWDSGKTEAPASCVTEGKITYTCIYDPSHQKTENTGYDKNNHLNTEITPETEGSCTKPVYSEGVYCNDCEKYVSGHIALGTNPRKHQWEEDRRTDGTCSEKGKIIYICKLNGEHTYYDSTDFNPENHINTKKVPETPATINSVGYTEGVYCNDCKKYISGHLEIPKLSVPFEESSVMLLFEDTIVVFSDAAVKDILSRSAKGAVVTDKNGKVLSDENAVPTGAILKVTESTEYEIVISGDVNGDGRVTAADARLTLRASVGLESLGNDTSEMKAADVNGKGITAADARLILRASVGLEDRKEWAAYIQNRNG